MRIESPLELFNRLPPTAGGCRAVGLALAALVLFVGWPAAADAQGGAVRYSYEKIDVDGQTQWGLVPEAVDEDLSGDLSKSQIFEAFKLLKDDKDGTYGNSKVRIRGKLPDQVEVSVKIDPEKGKKGMAPIIMAETVYTLTELGVEEVEFPGYYKGGMKREDVPFYGYSLTVPLWRALPPGNLVQAQVRLPDGELIPAAQFYQRWKRGDRQLQQALFSYLDDPQTFTVKRVLKLLPELDLEYAGQVIPLLEHDSSAIRKRALGVLEESRSDEKVLEAVLSMMKSDDKDALAREAAEFLGKASADRYSIERDLYVLANGDEEESVEAAEALAERRGNDRAVEAIDGALTDERDAVARAAADGLEALGAEKEQIRALENDSVGQGLRLSIARMLSKSDSANSKRTGLKYVVENTKARSAEIALRQLGEMSGDTVRRDIESFLSADTRRKRLTAAEVLVQRADPEALDVLASAVEGGQNTREMEEYAYQLMVAQPLSDVRDFANGNNATIKRIAYSALGERAQKEGAGEEIFDTLVAGAESNDPAIRGASARALGVFADEDALEVLESLSDDSEAQVRAGVAAGLSHYQGGEMGETLVEYLDDSDPEVVASAIEAMEERVEKDHMNKLKDLTEADDPRVRSAALSAVSQLVPREDDKQVRQTISMLSGAVSDESRMVKFTAIEQLSTFQDKRAATGIAIQLNAEDLELRVAAIEALGKNGHDSATELIIDVLDDSNPDVRRAAIVAIGDLEDTSAEQKLEALLEDEDDPEIKDLIERTLSEI